MLEDDDDSDPGLVAGLCDAAGARAESGDLVGAAHLFQQALAHLPPGCAAVQQRRGIVLEQLAQCWMELQEDDGACQAAVQATHADPQSPAAWHTLGRCQRNGGELQRAEAALLTALGLLRRGPHCANDRPAATDDSGADDVAAELAEVRLLLRRQLALWVGVPQMCILQHPGGGGGPACRVWEAGVLMARFLADHGAEIGLQQGARVLELGAGGSGVVGLTAAVSAGAHVLMTDNADVAPWLRRAVEANRQLLATCRGSVKVAQLDWADLAASGGRQLPGSSCDSGSASAAAAADVASSEAWEWVVGADLVYSANQVPCLTAALRTLFARVPPGCRLLLAHKHRHADVDAALHAALEAMGFRSTTLKAYGAPPEPALARLPGAAALSLTLLRLLDPVGTT